MERAHDNLPQKATVAAGIDTKHSLSVRAPPKLPIYEASLNHEAAIDPAEECQKEPPPHRAKPEAKSPPGLGLSTYSDDLLPMG